MSRVMSPVMSRMDSMSRQRAATGLALIVLAVAAIAFPLVFGSPVVTNYAVYALIFVAVVTAWNMFSGFSGYISLGQAVFFGSGAYAVGIAAKAWHINGVGVFALLPLAAAVGAAIAVPFGLIALRVRRHTFFVVTIAVFFIFQLMAFNLNSFTGGTIGMSAPFLPWTPTAFNDRFYYITLACAVIAHNLLRAAGTLAGGDAAVARGATLRRDLIDAAARTARHGRGHLTLHLPEGWHREQEWLNLLEAACGPPAAAA